MLLLDRPTGVAPTRDSGATPFHLRFRVGGELVELPVGKTTIGSSPRCGLRIDRPGVQPVHCLIVGGAEGLSVRRWAADTQLNGAPFNDARLTAGDCLAIGGVELELVGAVPVTEAIAPPAVEEAAAETAAAEPVDYREQLIAARVQSVVTNHTDDVIDVCEPCVETSDAVESQAQDACQDEDVPTFGDAWPAVVEPVAEFVATEVPAVETEAVVEGVEAVRSLDELEVTSAPGSAGGEAATEIEADSQAYALENPRQSRGLTDATDEQCDAAEFIFQSLQTACGISRGRTHKLLTALRAERNNSRQLASLLSEATGELNDLNRERADWEQASIGRESDSREWQDLILNLRREISELETRLADHSRQMSELQQDLTSGRAEGGLRGSAAVAIEPQAPVIERYVPSALEVVAPVEVIESTAVVAEEVPPTNEYVETVEEVPAAAWDASSDRVAPEWGSAEGNAATSSSFLERIGVEQVATESQDSDPFGAESAEALDWSTPLAAEPQESAATGWQTSANDVIAADDDVFGGPTAGPLEVEQPAWESQASESADEATSDDDVSPFADFSIWKQGAARDEATFGEPEAEVVAPAVSESPAAIWGRQESVLDASDSVDVFSRDEEVAREVEVPAVVDSELAGSPHPGPLPEGEGELERPKYRPTSFIERYSHMFAEEGGEQAASEPAKPQMSGGTLSDLRAMGVERKEPSAKPTASEDEESLQLYMAKLLERVRGQVSSPASEAPPSTLPKQPTPTSTPATIRNPAPAPVGAPQEPVNSDASEGEADELTDEEVQVNWDAIAKRAAAAPKTDLTALRALANDSARRAIGRHSLEKHRRNAVTKVIVSTLAGMTSLWLMLLAPSWSDLQFITACGTLIIAAYWAGDTIRAMLESFRAAGYGMTGRKRAAP